LPRHGKIIFIHGCFWHGHKRCQRSKRPTTNKYFWGKKLDANIERDGRSIRKLRRMGWKVLVVWQCETLKLEKLLLKLERFLHEK
jgi:DNA mismatch endonuclease (patch repair protein)